MGRSVVPGINRRGQRSGSSESEHRQRTRHPPQTLTVQSITVLRPRRIIPGTKRDPQAPLPRSSTPPTDHSGDGARPTREKTHQHSSNSSSPPTNIPGDEKKPTREKLRRPYLRTPPPLPRRLATRRRRKGKKVQRRKIVVSGSPHSAHALEVKLHQRPDPQLRKNPEPQHRGTEPKTPARRRSRKFSQRQCNTGTNT